MRAYVRRYWTQQVHGALHNSFDERVVTLQRHHESVGDKLAALGLGISAEHFDLGG